VQFQTASDSEREARYDAVIVTANLSDEVNGEVVITLPDTDDTAVGPDRRSGHLTTPHLSADVHIRDHREVVGLLEEHVPGGQSRVDRLASAQRLLFG
jgi:hypothetical protein